MTLHPNRRRFLQTGAALAGTMALAGSGKSVFAGSRFEGKGFHKAVIVGHPDEAKLAEVKAAGFGGVEANLWGQKDKMVTPEEAAAAGEIAEKMELRIHTVMRGWAQLNDPDPAKIKADLDFTIGTLKAAQGYGCDALLIVPGRIGDSVEMPGKKDYSIRFDEKSGHVTRLVEGDNSRYEACLKAHNHAWDTCRAGMEKLIPVAQETGVILAVENVWNNLFLTPEHYAAFIDSFKSPWVKSYFDVANHIAYGPPAEDWIKVLGDRIVKVHIKDYKDQPAEGGSNWPPLSEGDVNFPAVIQALKEHAHYEGGWLTIEGSGELALAEQNQRLETIIAGA